MEMLHWAVSLMVGTQNVFIFIIKQDSAALLGTLVDYAVFVLEGVVSEFCVLSNICPVISSPQGCH